MSLDLVAQAVGAAAAKSDDDAVVIDVGELLGITDHFVVCSGGNDRQVRAVVEEVERRVKLSPGGRSPRMVEGLDDARWVLMDYGDFVVHVFVSEARSFYDLERLWGDAPRVELQQAAGAQS